MSNNPSVSWGTKETATPEADIKAAISRTGYPAEAANFAARLDSLRKSFLLQNGREPMPKELDDILRASLRDL